MAFRWRSACAIAFERACSPVRLRRLSAARRHRFLILALLAGPLGGALLYLAAHAVGLRLPAVSLSGVSLVKALLLAPVLEELIFRGGIQTLLDRTARGARPVVRGVTVGNVLTSALFAAAHLWVAPLALAAAIFLPSLVFGRLRQLYPSLLPAMVVHAVYNGCYLVTGMTWSTRF